jgi:hypothetical protein
LARYGYILLDRYDGDISRQAMQLDTSANSRGIFIDRNLKALFGDVSNGAAPGPAQSAMSCTPPH